MELRRQEANIKRSVKTKQIAKIINVYGQNKKVKEYIKKNKDLTEVFKNRKAILNQNTQKMQEQYNGTLRDFDILSERANKKKVSNHEEELLSDISRAKKVYRDEQLLVRQRIL